MCVRVCVCFYVSECLLCPTQDAAFITEVHHINGEGQDAGVVYCEMQACENTARNRTEFEMMQLLYPGRCGYKVSLE